MSDVLERIASVLPMGIKAGANQVQMDVDDFKELYELAKLGRAWQEFCELRKEL
jgi:hypothetical protein